MVIGVSCYTQLSWDWGSQRERYARTSHEHILENRAWEWPEGASKPVSDWRLPQPITCMTSWRGNRLRREPCLVSVPRKAQQGSGGTLPQKSATGFWHMPERHNRILLGADTEGGIKENQSEIQREFFLHTLLHNFFYLVVLWSNLIVGVQTAARGAVCVFCRSRLEILEKVLRMIL